MLCRALSSCASICRPSTMCVYDAPSPMPSIAMGSSRRSGVVANRLLPLARGLTEWSLPINQLGVGAKYYQYNPREAQTSAGRSRVSQGL